MLRYLVIDLSEENERTWIRRIFLRDLVRFAKRCDFSVTSNFASCPKMA